MGKESNPPSIAEHVTFGRAVKAFRHATGQFLTGNKDGLGVWRFRASSPQAKAFMRLERAMMDLKCVLDSDVCRMLPLDDRRATHVYYGGDDGFPEVAEWKTTKGTRECQPNANSCPIISCR
jgi:hypothetical protein